MNRPEINVTPLIDVLLVLLIIFMIVSPTKPSSLEAKVPAERKDDGSRALPPPLMLVVTVEPSGELRLNTESLGATVADPAPLTERLRKVFAERETNRAYSQNSDTSGNPRIEKTVFIKPQPRTIMAALRRWSIRSNFPEQARLGCNWTI